MKAKGYYRGESSQATTPKLMLYSEIELKQNSPHVCAICDEGGDLVVCDGPCHRHFHKNVDCPAGKKWKCPSVCLAPDYVGEWQCFDCKHKTRSCFKCYVVGACDLEVKKCPHPLCVRSYCHVCLEPGTSACGLHICASCHQGPNDDEDGFLVQCMRCPSAWHKDCLEFIQKRGFATDRTIYTHTAHGQPNKGMFYCPAHDIDPTLGTPTRGHISWI